MANELDDKDPQKLEKKSPKWVRDEIKISDRVRNGYWKTAIAQYKTSVNPNLSTQKKQVSYTFVLVKR